MEPSHLLGWLARHYRVALVLAVLLYGFGLIASEVVEGEPLAIDDAILTMLREPGNPAEPIGPPQLQEAARDVTALGSYAVLTLIVAAVALSLLFMHRWRTAAFIVGAVVTGTMLSTALKGLFDRPRPDLTGIVAVFTSSFPSGHATVSAVAYLTLGACLAETTGNRGLKAFYIGYAALLTAIVGVSRVYLGVHYPSDVAAGWAIGRKAVG